MELANGTVQNTERLEFLARKFIDYSDPEIREMAVLVEQSCQKMSK